jgi:hypothetical protein
VLAATALLTCASSSNAATRIVGGTAIHIPSAPWAVFIRQSVPGGSLLCSGSILDSLHVLTAAHCLYDSSEAQASITSLSIRAGISNYNSPQSGDAEQDRQVSSLRIDPAYVPGAVNPDDVAVLALSDPLDLSGPAVAAVALPAAGAAYPAGAEVGIAGFGRESSATPPDGSLNWLTAVIDPQGGCGGHSNTVIPDFDAIAFCAIPAAGTACTGDSGGGLVTTAGTRTLVGVVSAGPLGCTGGGAVILTYVGAPEILSFIQGDDQPPVAPRRTSTTYVNLSWRGVLRAGATLSCTSGDWQGAPTFAYTFANSQDGQVLQHGPSPTYLLRPANVGDRVFCSALATNDGGAALIATGSTAPVEAAPKLAIGPIAPVAAVRGKTVAVRIVLKTVAGENGKFAACITPPAEVAARVCASQEVPHGGFVGLSLTLDLTIKPSAPVGASRLTVTAAAGASRGEATALIRVARS